ncbi:LysR family transcriptional regulator [Roseomonas sp. BN140053]|uniref:LysR family transcriptional regulator n=1 Tax=Roseomonas sp. BN140053 TaxID=3391898 RepID=UPI0039E89658
MMDLRMWGSLPGLRDLECFAVAARVGSLGAAAPSLGLSQPALSQALNRLEAQLGCRLLLRGPRGSFPSQAGAGLLARWERMQAQLRAGLAACGSTARPGLLTDAAVETHLAIGAAGTFSAAARRRGVTLPTLARTAHGLERCLGVQLYRRSSEGTVPLPGGLELARRLALARVEIEQGLAELAATGAEARFRLGVLPMVPQAPLARAVLTIADGLPLQLSTHEGDHAALLRQLRHGQLDAVLGAVRTPAALTDVTETPLAQDAFVLAAPAGHALANRGSVTPEALASTDWVLAELPLSRRFAAEALFATLPRRPRVLLETNSPQTTVAVLRAAGALALLSWRQIAAAGDLTALPTAITGPARWIGLTARREWLPTAAQQAALAALQLAFDDAGHEGCR